MLHAGSPNFGYGVIVLDALAIWGKRQMCLQDYIARTRVITAPAAKKPKIDTGPRPATR